MRFIVSAVTLVIGGPSAASLLTHATALAHVLAGLSAALPDNSTVAVMFAGLGLVAGARRKAPRVVAG